MKKAATGKHGTKKHPPPGSNEEGYRTLARAMISGGGRGAGRTPHAGRALFSATIKAPAIQLNELCYGCTGIETEAILGIGIYGKMFSAMDSLVHPQDNQHSAEDQNSNQPPSPQQPNVARTPLKDTPDATGHQPDNDDY
jgi:hypothetical protein